MLDEQIVLRVQSATDNCEYTEGNLRGSASALIEELVCVRFLVQIFFTL